MHPKSGYLLAQPLLRQLRLDLSVTLAVIARFEIPQLAPGGLVLGFACSHELLSH